MKGNAHYEENDYAEAMTWYTASLTLAPRENVEYGLTIANRSIKSQQYNLHLNFKLI